MLNKIMIIGNLGQDPRINQTKAGKAIGNITVATSETYVKDGKKETTTEWHNVTLFEKQAELAQKYLKKGDKVYIEGKIRTESFNNKEGVKVSATKIICEVMKFLTPKGQDGQAPSTPPVASEPNWDDIPF